MTLERDLERIRALVERANHPSTPDEEARTSALLAVRLIGRHGLELVASSRSEGAWSVPSYRQGQTTAERGSTARPEPKVRLEPYHVMVSTYRGRCKSCRKPYVVGDRIAWAPDEGATHYECRAWHRRNMGA